MQQGHPRHKQLSRARHVMYLHNRHKAEGVLNAIKNLMTGINKAISVVSKRISSSLGIDEQISVPNVDYDKFEIKDIATDMFRNNPGIVNGK
ncbi:hypothetical protein [Leuconostoc mesenteroides]|uniref:hypothetical protein n=1 Tax=Leuconostoc mesenteroides TaxID=1245 RepID=UPI000A010087|nr:hypothetical protein [Leuconostoc mesenteroides]ARN64097.1 hypothetical protein A0F18_08620 [Leuconostoc mesenteroides subsp. mesenteroides]MBZ1527808.1 hypothetical protein [Leuconostoc mesenteroides]MCI2152389.1 hypothetical protein [Leuconostoc mesenteroides]MCI2167993.1 hypothetical protein [Leuconostoc mesenteroides]MDV8927609.1 hypothetical protein [Leuconostoc mesenteroides]